MGEAKVKGRGNRAGGLINKRKIVKNEINADCCAEPPKLAIVNERKTRFEAICAQNCKENQASD